MKKQIFFAHSGGPQGSPGRGSYDFVQWLRHNLGEEYHVHAPVIKEPDAPTYEMWKDMFDRELTGLQGRVFLIGHSLGGSTLLKYLSEESLDVNIAGLFLAAPPFWGSSGWDAEEFALLSDFSEHMPAIPELHLYHCLHDPVVPVDHMTFYQNLLPGAFIHKLNGSDHAFSDGLPLLLEHITSVEKFNLKFYPRE